MTLLCIIYLSFIALGLPDSLLGSAWPTMRLEMGAPLPMAGMVSMVCSGCTILSSLMSTRVIRRFGTGRVTMFSTLMTATALMGYALAPSPWVLVMAAIPLGLGGGSVDAALNNYVALHYEARHMSWLHCSWGVGAMAGPMILSAVMASGGQWRMGYWICISVQLLLTLMMALTLPLWQKQKPAAALAQSAPAENAAMMSNREALRLPGMMAVLITFLCYCAFESTMGLWTASYAQQKLGATPEQSAFLTSLFFAGLTLGRALNGFLTMRLSSKFLIRASIAIILTGVLLMMLPLGYIGCLLATGLIGLGCAPVYPCTIHETPHRFGTAASQAATGLQMAFAYTGSTFLPPLMGLISGANGMDILPWWLLTLGAGMLLGNEVVNRQTAGKNA